MDLLRNEPSEPLGFFVRAALSGATSVRRDYGNQSLKYSIFTGVTRKIRVTFRSLDLGRAG